MRILFTFFLFSFHLGKAQELFVFTEPASNMAAKSIGLRLNNYYAKRKNEKKYDYQLMPEIMWGLSKKIMIHAEGFLSNIENDFKAEGVSVYMKYRFYSQDEVHSHFRMAAFVKAAVNGAVIQQEAIDLSGYNSGYESGLITTRLMNKLAFSATVSFIHATDNGTKNKSKVENRNRDAISYSFSAGRLMLPRNYIDYNQTNFNIMAEILGQTNVKTAKTYLDIAPSVQFIILSKMRVDMGYKIALVNDLGRTSDDSFLLRLEYNFFNVYK